MARRMRSEKGTSAELDEKLFSARAVLEIAQRGKEEARLQKKVRRKLDRLISDGVYLIEETESVSPGPSKGKVLFRCSLVLSKKEWEAFQEAAALACMPRSEGEEVIGPDVVSPEAKAGYVMCYLKEIFSKNAWAKGFSLGIVNAFEVLYAESLRRQEARERRRGHRGEVVIS